MQVCDGGRSPALFLSSVVPSWGDGLSIAADATVHHSGPMFRFLLMMRSVASTGFTANRHSPDVYSWDPENPFSTLESAADLPSNAGKAFRLLVALLLVHCLLLLRFAPAFQVHLSMASSDQQSAGQVLRACTGANRMTSVTCTTLPGTVRGRPAP